MDSTIKLSDGTVIPVIRITRYYDPISNKEFIGLDISNSLMGLSDAIVIFNQTRVSNSTLNPKDQTSESLNGYSVDGINAEFNNNSCVQVRLGKVIQSNSAEEARILSSYKTRYNAYVEEQKAKEAEAKAEMERLEAEAATIREELNKEQNSEEEMVVEDD